MINHTITRTILLGCGSMGKNHLRLLQEIPGFELVGVVDPNPNVRSLCGEIPYYSDLSQVEESAYTAAVVASPIDQHFEQGLHLLRLKKHVLMEKPLAQTSRQAAELQNLAKEMDCVLLTGHVERFNPAFLTFQREFAKKDLGNLFRFEFHRIGPYPANPGTFGVTEDLAVHDLDLFYQLNQSPIKKQYVHKSKQFHPTNEDGLLAHLELEDGATALFNVNWLSPRKQRFVRVYGEHGMLECNLFERRVFFFESKKRRNKPDEFGIHGIEYGETVEIEVENKEPLKEELQFFLACCQGREALSEERQRGAVFALEKVESFLNE